MASTLKASTERMVIDVDVVKRVNELCFSVSRARWCSSNGGYYKN